MTSLERVLTTLVHREPDRVPCFLLLTMHGAGELGMGIREYYAHGENVAEAQLRMRRRFGHDCLYAFFHTPLEVEAWGGEVIYAADGPPNSGEAPIGNRARIKDLDRDCSGVGEQFPVRGSCGNLEGRRALRE